MITHGGLATLDCNACTAHLVATEDVLRYSCNAVSTLAGGSSRGWLGRYFDSFHHSGHVVAVRRGSVAEPLTIQCRDLDDPWERAWFGAATQVAAAAGLTLRGVRLLPSRRGKS